MVYPHKTDMHLLARLLVGPFYKENAGLLATVLFICFGFFKTVPLAIAAHKGIMYEICTNHWVMLATMVVWLAYVFKTWAFGLQVLRDPRNECLFVMGLAPLGQAVVLWILVYFPLSLPITLYGGFSAYLGFQSGHTGAALFILAFHLLIGSVWALFFTMLQRQAHRRFAPAWSVRLPFSVTLPDFLFFGSHLVQERKLMLLVTKAISLLLLWGGFYLMRVQELDVRFGLMCMVAATTAHVNIVRKMREFEDHTMCWRRNLPIRPASLFLSYCLFFSLLLLPELLLIGRQIGSLLAWHEPLLFWVVGIVGLSYYHSLLYKKDMHYDRYMNLLFGSWLLFTFAIQFKLPPLVVSSLLIVYSYWLYSSRYYRYEAKVES